MITERRTRGVKACASRPDLNDGDFFIFPPQALRELVARADYLNFVNDSEPFHRLHPNSRHAPSRIRLRRLVVGSPRQIAAHEKISFPAKRRAKNVSGDR